MMLQEEETPDVEKKLQSIFKVIANHFAEPAKAEENLQKVHQMKDEGVFSALSTLLSPSTSVAEAATARVCGMRVVFLGVCVRGWGTRGVFCEWCECWLSALFPSRLLSVEQCGICGVFSGWLQNEPRVG